MEAGEEHGRALRKGYIPSIGRTDGKNEQIKKENQELRRENRQLCKENARLEKRLEALEATMEDRISRAVEATVAKATAPMLEMIAEKDKEIMRLKGQIKKDS